MVDFTLAPEIRDLRRRVRDFMEENVFPNEDRLHGEDDESESLIRDLQGKVKDQGMWAMFIGPEAGGTGQGFLPYAYVNEILGRSFAAPRAFGCQAPDTGNAEILHMFGTEEQQERWMRPVINGDKWCSSGAEGSAFGIVMASTDPDGPPHRRFSQIVVPTETPGLNIIRNVSVMGHAGR